MLTFGVLLVISLAVSCHCAAITDPCGTGWEQFDNKCYYFSQKLVPWDDSLGECEKVGGHLVRIDNQKKMDFVGKKSGSKRVDYWIDGNIDLNCGTGNWTWKTNGQPVTYFKWHPRQPDNLTGDEHCLEIYHKLQLQNDQRCFVDRRFVCEKPANC